MPEEDGKIKHISTEADKVRIGAITFFTNGEQITFFSEGTIKPIPAGDRMSKVLVERIVHIEIEDHGIGISKIFENVSTHVNNSFTCVLIFCLMKFLIGCFLHLKNGCCSLSLNEQHWMSGCYPNSLN
jgi:hypothetical protein